MKRFSQQILVQKHHIDEQNHVNNVIYVQWIQDVAVAHWVSEVSLKVQDELTWFLLRHEIDYKQQSFENDEITVTTWVGSATKVTCKRFTEIKRGEHLIVQAKSNWCLLDVKTRKPSRISEEIRELFEMT